MADSSEGKLEPAGQPAQTPILFWVCEYASANPDGTFTLIRAGIDKAQAPRTPVVFSGWIFAETAPGALSSQHHQVVLSFSMNGSELLRTPAVIIASSDPRAGYGHFTIPFWVTFPEFGNALIRLEVGDLKAEKPFSLTQSAGGSGQ